jgi:glutathione S-transferase
MKLYYSSASPYARKVLVTAHEAGLDGLDPVAAFGEVRRRKDNF